MMRLGRLCLLIAGLAGSGCSGGLNPSQADAVDAALADSLASVTQAVDVDMTLYEGSRAAVFLRAPLAVTSEMEDGNTETLFSQGVRIELVDSTGNRTNARSDDVLYESPASVFTLRGKVRVDGLSGRNMRTDTLIWDRSTQRIRTDGYVILVTESDSIYGYGLRATADLSDYSVLRITGSVSVKRGPRTNDPSNP